MKKINIKKKKIANLSDKGLNQFPLLKDTANMIQQAYQTLEYQPEYGFDRTSYANKLVRPSPYDAPSRSAYIHQQQQQQLLAHQQAYQGPQFCFNQPLNPININTNQQPASQINKNMYQIYPNQHNNTLNTNNEFNSQMIHEQNPGVQKTNTLKFKSNKNFDNKFKDYFILEDYIKSLKPNVSLRTAYINKYEELVIKTDHEEQIETLKTWPSDAFLYGIVEVIKTRNFYLALQHVDINFNIESERAKEHLKQRYGINNVLRMVKKQSGQKLEIVKASMSDSDKFNELIKTGYIKIGFSNIKVSPWRFGITPDQCFKCQKFGHTVANCTAKTETCLRCAKDHSFKKCPVKDPKEYQCVNCGQNHAACSKSCPELIKAVEAKKQKLDKKIQTTKPMTRIYSQNQQDGIPNKQAIGMVKLMIELFKNISRITAAANEDPGPIVDLINQNLGHEFGTQMSNILFKNIDIDDPFMREKFLDNDQF